MLTIAGFLGQSPSSLGQTIALLLTFLGIGVIVNVLIIYVVAQVLAERKENQERARAHGVAADPAGRRGRRDGPVAGLCTGPK